MQEAIRIIRYKSMEFVWSMTIFLSNRLGDAAFKRYAKGKDHEFDRWWALRKIVLSYGEQIRESM